MLNLMGKSKARYEDEHIAISAVLQKLFPKKEISLKIHSNADSLYVYVDGEYIDNLASILYEYHYLQDYPYHPFNTYEEMQELIVDQQFDVSMYPDRYKWMK